MLRRGIGIAATLVMLIAAVVVLPQRGRAADTENVLVVNGSRRPVPVSLMSGGSVSLAGTPNVNVANQPTVALAGGTNVGISGTPNVNVANTPNVTVGNTPNVSVANSPTVNLAPGTNVGIAPGTVLDVRNVSGSRQPVHEEVQLTNTFNPPKAVLTVPAGKRFVLEDLSAFGVVATGEKVG